MGHLRENLILGWIHLATTDTLSAKYVHWEKVIAYNLPSLCTMVRVFLGKHRHVVLRFHLVFLTIAQFHFICLLPVSLVVRLGFRLFLTRVLICYQQTINQGVYANFRVRFLISLFPLTTIRWSSLLIFQEHLLI